MFLVVFKKTQNMSSVFSKREKKQSEGTSHAMQRLTAANSQRPQQQGSSTRADSFINIPEIQQPPASNNFPISMSNSSNVKLTTTVGNDAFHVSRRRSTSKEAPKNSSMIMSTNSVPPIATASFASFSMNSNNNNINNNLISSPSPDLVAPPPPPSHPQLNLQQRFTKDQTVHLGVIETILGDLAELSTDIGDANIYDMRKNSLNGWSGSINRSLVTLSSAIKGALADGERAIQEAELLMKEKEALMLVAVSSASQNNQQQQQQQNGIFGVQEKSVAIMQGSDDDEENIDESEIKQVASVNVGNVRLGSKIVAAASGATKDNNEELRRRSTQSRTNSFYQQQQLEVANALLNSNNTNNNPNNSTTTTGMLTSVSSMHQNSPQVNKSPSSNTSSRETPSQSNFSPLHQQQQQQQQLQNKNQATSSSNEILSGRRSTINSNNNNNAKPQRKSPLMTVTSPTNSNGSNNNNIRQSFSLTNYVAGAVYFILDSLLATIDCSWCSCFLLQARSNELVLVASVGTRRDQKPGSLRLSATSGIESVVLSTGIGMNITHAYSEDEFNPAQDQVTKQRKAPTNDGTLLVNTGEQKSSPRVERTKSELVFPLIRPGLDGSNWGSHSIGIIQCCNKRRAKGSSHYYSSNMAMPSTGGGAAVNLEELSFQDAINNNVRSSSHGYASATFNTTNFTGEDEHRVAETCHVLCTVLARHPCDITSPLCHDAAQYLNKTNMIMTSNDSTGGSNNGSSSNFGLGGKGIFIPSPSSFKNTNNNTNNTVASSPSHNTSNVTNFSNTSTSNSQHNGARVFASASSDGSATGMMIQPGTRHAQLVYRTSKAGHAKRAEVLQGASGLPTVATISDAMDHVATVTSGWKNAVMLNVELEQEVSKFKDQVRNLQRDKARLEATLAERFLGGGGNGGK